MINFVLSKLLRDRFCDIIFFISEPCIHGEIIFKKINAIKYYYQFLVIILKIYLILIQKMLL